MVCSQAVNGWLADYPHSSVAVFDFCSVLTSNGGNANASDVGWATGNHHRWWQGAEQHVQTVASNFAAYYSDGSDSHPTAQACRRRHRSSCLSSTRSTTAGRGPRAHPRPPARTPTATSTVTLAIELYLPIILKGYLRPGGPTP